MAAILVVAFHASESFFQTPRFWHEAPFHRFFDFGHAGVIFFFILSGFIIASAHWDDLDQPERISNYLVRRFIRVYPAYWIVLVPIVAMYVFSPGISGSELSSQAVIANSFLLIGMTNQASLAVAWTLFHEILFYILFAIAILNRRAGIIVLSLWFGGCLVGAIIAPELGKAFYPLALINILFAAGMGIFLGTRRRGLPMPGVLALCGCLGFLAAGLFEVQVGFASGAVSIACYGLSSALILAGLISLESRRPVRIGALALMLGDASYAIYLVHYPSLSIVVRLWQKIVGKYALPIDLTYIIIVAICVLIGVAFHLLVERPLVAGLNLAWRRWRQARCESQDRNVTAW